MRNKLKLFLLLILTVALISACSGDDTEKDKGSKGSDDAVKISWMTYPPFTPEYQTMLEDQIKMFEAEHENIKINWIRTIIVSQ